MRCRPTSGQIPASSPFSLPKWREIPKFKQFVESYGRLLSLYKPSSWSDKTLIQKRMGLRRGLTGKVTTLLGHAAELAIRQPTKGISAEMIDEAAVNGIFKLAPAD